MQQATQFMQPKPCNPCYEDFKKFEFALLLNKYEPCLIGLKRLIKKCSQFNYHTLPVTPFKFNNDVRISILQVLYKSYEN